MVHPLIEKMPDRRMPRSVFVLAELDREAPYDLEKIERLVRQRIILRVSPPLAEKLSNAGLDPKHHYLIPMLDPSKPAAWGTQHKRVGMTADESGNTIVFKGVGVEEPIPVRFGYDPERILETQMFQGANLKEHAHLEAESSEMLHEEFQTAMEEGDPIVQRLAKMAKLSGAPTFKNIGVFRPVHTPVALRQRPNEKWEEGELGSEGFITEPTYVKLNKASEKVAELERARAAGRKTSIAVVKSPTALKEIFGEDAERLRVHAYEVPVNWRVTDSNNYPSDLSSIMFASGEKKERWKKIFSSFGIELEGRPTTQQVKEALNAFVARLALAIHLLRRREGAASSIDESMSSLSPQNVTGSGHVMDLDTVQTYLGEKEREIAQKRDEDNARDTIKWFAGYFEKEYRNPVYMTRSADWLYKILKKSREYLKSRGG